MSENKSEVIGVLGASGEIGARIVQTLFHAGHPVRAISRSPGPRLARWKELDFRQADFGDAKRLAEAIEGCGILINCSIDKRVDDGESNVVRRNVEGSRNVLETARRAGIRRIVHVSSIAVLPPRLTQGVVDNPFTFDGDSDWYGNAKIQTEKFFLEPSPGIEIVTVRLGVVYGPYMSWSRLAFNRMSSGMVSIPSGATSVCHAIHVDDAVKLLVDVGKSKQLAERLIYGINPQRITWAQYYAGHAEAVPLSGRITSASPEAYAFQISPRAGFREVAKWLYHSPLISPRTRQSNLVKKLTRRLVALPTAAPEEVAPNPDAKVCWPTKMELELYQSDAVFTPQLTGANYGFEYTVPFSVGVRSAAAWWRFDHAG